MIKGYNGFLLQQLKAELFSLNEDNGLKMFAFVEKLIKEKCIKPKDIYGDD